MAASGRVIGQSIFPGEELARNLAGRGQALVNYMVADEPKAPAAVPQIHLPTPYARFDA